VNLLLQNIVQDTQRTSPPLQVQDTELKSSLNVTDSDSIQSHEQDFQHDKCAPFISFEPITEHPSNHEPFKRAEHQPFFLCASYVDYFVILSLSYSIQVSSPSSNDVFERIIPVDCPEPEDDPPIASYQESVLRQNRVFLPQIIERKLSILHLYLYGPSCA
jgi:hypothetical protein